jgi:hypothetical protein
MKKGLLLLISLTTGLLLHAQANFQKAITIPFITDAVTKTVVQCSDGGYLIGTGSSNFTAGHSCLIKTDALGIITWTKSIAVTSANSTLVQAGECPGGYYVLADNSDTLAINDGFSVTRLDASGNILWAKMYPNSQPGYGHSKIRPTSDGGFVISQSFSIKMGALKIDGNGNVLWTMSYSDNVNDQSPKCPSFDCYISHQGSIIYVGKRGGDILLVKTDQDGQLLWSSTIGDQVTYHHPNSITGTADGGYVVCGSADYRPFILKVTSTGAIVWYHIYTTTYGGELTQIKELPNGNFLTMGAEDITGTVVSTFDANGNVLSASRFGNGNGATLMDPAMSMTSDGGFVVAGVYNDPTLTMMTAIALMKTDTNGLFACDFNPQFMGFFYTQSLPTVLNVPIYSFVQSTIENTQAQVFANENATETDFCLLFSTGDQQKNDGGITAFPSPVAAGNNLQLNISGAEGTATIFIYNASGQIIKTLNQNLSANTMLEIPTTGFSSGIYLVRVCGANENLLGTTRFIVR